MRTVILNLITSTRTVTLNLVVLFWDVANAVRGAILKNLGWRKPTRRTTIRDTFFFPLRLLSFLTSRGCILKTYSIMFLFDLKILMCGFENNKITCCVEDPGILSSRSVATSVDSSHLSTLLRLCWSDDLLLESCLLDICELEAYWADGWSIGWWWLAAAVYGTNVEQGLGIAPGFWFPKKVKGCNDGCMGIGPGGTGTGTG